MNEFYAILLGLVQGISEWLPISSKTQILFASTLLFSLPLAVAYAFGLFMEIGSVGSALVYFRRDIRSLLSDRRLVVYLLVVTVATGLVGAPLYYLTDKVLSTSPYNIGILIAIAASALIGIVVISYLLKFAKKSRIYMIDFVLGAIALVLGIIATLFAPQSAPVLS